MPSAHRIRRPSASTTGASGDLGWHTGAFTVTDATGKAVGTGKYSEIKQNGKWVLIRDIWNNDAPAVPAVPAATPAATPEKPAE